MKGVAKLKVPSVPMIPRLFVITLRNGSYQYRFSKVAYSLSEAIGKCYSSGHLFTLTDYVSHVELTVDEINGLFKNFRP